MYTFTRTRTQTLYQKNEKKTERRKKNFCDKLLANCHILSDNDAMRLNMISKLFLYFSSTFKKKKRFICDSLSFKLFIHIIFFPSF